MADAYVDKLSSFMGVAFGLNYFLAFGLEIGECDLTCFAMYSTFF